MPNPDELIAIVDRILNGSRDESEIAQLRQWLKVSGTTLQFVSQDGKFNTNIGQVQGGEIHIGDRHYQVDVEALRELLQPTTTLPNIDWQAVSQATLEEQLRLTTNPLTSGEGISYRTEQVYVPLGLVERKWQTRRGEDVSPEQGSLLYEETEITQRFEHEQFLEQVLQQGQSPRSGGKRIAIIGEPGAGKTTLLQQIAQWVSEQVEGAIAIWVSLADLRGQELEAYLLERWLQAVARKLGQAEASGEVKDAFVAQFQPGRVWLLLDGVDEMQVSSGNPLAEMSRQVRMGGLLSQARIMLSCRLNLWDGDHNALDTFDTYRTLEFSYPQQVERFIGQWFGALPEGQVGQAERLCAALKAPGKERIQDLVKNPLRLTLLCFNWYLGEGTLPQTKAGLYEQFVADFYEWKREQFPTTAEQRRQLNAALGELAREAIDKEATRFRLRHDFVCEFLGEPDEEGSLFQLALQLGWLNKVGVEAENQRKAVYAFFHPTFQEYFAALAINNWQFFLHHVPENPDHPDASYRVFEAKWKQTFISWLGRKEILNRQKEELIDTLINFDYLEGWSSQFGFYKYRALFLAAFGIAEFREYNSSDLIVKHLFQLSFGEFNSQSEELKRFYKCIEDEAQAALIESSHKTVAKELLKFIQKEASEIGVISLKSIGMLEKALTSNHQNIFVVIRAIKYSYDRNLICTLADLIKNLSLGLKEIFFLVSVIESTEDIRAIKSAEILSAQISNNSNNIIPILIKLIEISSDKYIGKYAAERLEKIATFNSEEVIPLLVKILQESRNEYAILQAAYSLEKIAPHDELVIDALTESFIKTNDAETRKKLAEILERISYQNKKVIGAMLRMIEERIDEEACWQAIESLGKLAKYDNQAIYTLEKLLSLSQDDCMRFRIAESLWRIHNGNLIASTILTKYIQGHENGSIQNDLLKKTKEFTELESILPPPENQGVIISELSSHTGEFEKLEDEISEQGLMEYVEQKSEENKTNQEEDNGSNKKQATALKIIELIEDIKFFEEVVEGMDRIAKSNDPSEVYKIKLLLQILELVEERDSLNYFWKILHRFIESSTLEHISLEKLIGETANQEVALSIAKLLKELFKNDPIKFVIILKGGLSDLFYNKYPDCSAYCYETIWISAQKIVYPVFYNAWHSQITTS